MTGVPIISVLKPAARNSKPRLKNTQKERPPGCRTWRKPMNTTTEWTSRRQPVSTASLARTIPVFALGMSLSLFLVISYVLCVLFYILFPDLVLNHAVLMLFLPGFKLLDLPSFILGAIESFGYGWYAALIF